MGERVSFKGIPGNLGELTEPFYILITMVVTPLHTFVEIGRNEH